MRDRFAMAIATIVGTLACASVVFGQVTNKNGPQPVVAKAPNVASNDLTGVWNALRGNYDTASFSKGDPPMTPWGQQQFNEAKPSQGPRGVRLSDTTDMVYKCFPPGMPYIYLQLFPVEIVQTPTQVIELFEYDHTVRHIYLDRREHPADITPSYYGDSIGHWEGDTLVVDTVGLNGKMWLDRVGHPDSDQMHITEHIHRMDQKTLQVDLTFDDPKSYTKPWTATMRFALHPTWHVIEDICQDNQAFESFEK